MPEGVAILDYIQEKCTDKLAAIGKRFDPIDGYLINFAREENLVDIDVAKGNFYIKLRKEDRKYNLSRRTSNCTICSVYSPSNIENVRVINRGRISDEIG